MRAYLPAAASRLGAGQFAGALGRRPRNFGQLADREHHGIGEAVGSDEAQLALAERGAGRERDVDAHGLGDGRRGGTAHEAHQFGANLGDLLAIFRGGGGLFGQFLGLVAQLGGLRGSQRLEVVHHGGLHTGARD